jgi:hypothetical protein
MHPSPEQLKELQDSIWKEKVLRARKMTEAERFNATLEQIDLAFQWMLAGVRMQFPEANEADARRILAERLDRLRSIQDRGLFIPAPAEP